MNKIGQKYIVVQSLIFSYVVKYLLPFLSVLEFVLLISMVKESGFTLKVVPVSIRLLDYLYLLLKSSCHQGSKVVKRNF